MFYSVPILITSQLQVAFSSQRTQHTFFGPLIAYFSGSAIVLDLVRQDINCAFVQVADVAAQVWHDIDDILLRGYSFDTQIQYLSVLGGGRVVLVIT